MEQDHARHNNTMTTYVPIANAPPDFWFNALVILFNELGPADPIYKYWFNVLGSQCGTSIINTAAFCDAGVPLIPDMNAASLEQYGVQALVDLYVQDFIFSTYCVAQ